MLDPPRSLSIASDLYAIQKSNCAVRKSVGSFAGVQYIEPLHGKKIAYCLGMSQWHSRKKFYAEEGHRRSIRMKGYDYSRPGAYFVTVCTKNREYAFGEIVNGSMVLNDLGSAVEHFWKEIPRHFPLVTLGPFTVMPNHLHGILLINSSTQSSVVAHHVGVRYIEPLQRRHQYQKLLKDSIGAIVLNFKAALTRWACRNDHKNFRWQRNYYERIIRKGGELRALRRYIAENPAHWNDDAENPMHTVSMNQPKMEEKSSDLSRQYGRQCSECP